MLYAFENIKVARDLLQGFMNVKALIFFKEI